MRITKNCRSCNKPFSISGSEQEWFKGKGLEPFTHCKQCRAKEKKICRSCKEAFFISESEKKWLAGRGLKPFANCQKCRKERRDGAGAGP